MWDVRLRGEWSRRRDGFWQNRQAWRCLFGLCFARPDQPLTIHVDSEPSEMEFFPDALQQCIVGTKKLYEDEIGDPAFTLEPRSSTRSPGPSRSWRSWPRRSPAIVDPMRERPRADRRRPGPAAAARGCERPASARRPGGNRASARRRCASRPARQADRLAEPRSAPCPKPRPMLT